MTSILLRVYGEEWKSKSTAENKGKERKSTETLCDQGEHAIPNSEAYNNDDYLSKNEFKLKKRIRCCGDTTSARFK